MTHQAKDAHRCDALMRSMRNQPPEIGLLVMMQSLEAQFG
jgi:hypothetical protein